MSEGRDEAEERRQAVLTFKQGQRQLDDWIEDQVERGLLVRHRDGSVSQPRRRRVHSVSGGRLSLAALDRALAATQQG